MKYAETVIILIYELLKHFGRAQIGLVLKLRLVDVIDDDLIFRVLLVFLINGYLSPIIFKDTESVEYSIWYS